MKLKQYPSAVVVDFAQFEIEGHVQKALHMAWRFSEGRPLDAGHLLKSALVVARSEQSEAFQKLASLAPISGLREPSAKLAPTLPKLDLSAAPVVRPVGEAFSIAHAFLEKGRIWGRDYITLALLATDDPALEEFAQQAGVDPDAVRSEWLEFVQSNRRHRDPDSWSRWFRSAGTGRPSGDTVEAQAATAYLFTWNPTQFSFPKLEQHVGEIREKSSAVVRWSTGNRKDISPGARVFLLRQGPEPRGLVGVGRVASELIEHPHWDQAKRDLGRTSFLVDVQWEALSRDPLIDRSRLIEQTGETSLWSSQSGGVEIPADIVQQLEQSWPGVWERRLHGLADDYLPYLPTRKLIAQIDPDTGRGTDSLNIDRYVDAFARVMASRNLTPPLSIGLFGDWGSGKTFFMERLEARVDALSKDALSKEDEGESPLYWPNICQIRFNAWHYAETDLWASLVSTIFNRLRVHLDGEKDDGDEFNKLLQKLELAGELRKEAEERLKEAAGKQRLALKDVAEAEQALRDLPPPPEPSDDEVRKILSSNVSQAAAKSQEEIAALLDSAAEWAGRDDFKEAAKLLRQGEQTVEQARAVLEETRALSGRVGFWWRILSSAKLYKTPGFWALVGLLVAIPVGFVWAHEALKRFGSWPQIWAILAEVLTAVGASIAWVRARMAKAGPVFDRLDSLQSTIEKKIETAQKADRDHYEQARARAQTAEQRAQSALDLAQRGLSEAEEAERQAEVAVKQSTSQVRLGRFIRERASTADYEKHLGLIAMIHRDFRRLSDLMETARSQPNDPGLPRVDRIVLYIDDLDRCHPPERVVRVLEAVHLLLFFPLFVVVVGVDSRWVSRALFKHYEEMLADESMTTNGEAGALRRAPADSQDFLEKIFQVPFWLRRMDPGAVQRMIHSMISEDELAGAPPEDEEAPPDSVDDAMNDPELSADATASDAAASPASEESDAGRAAAKRVTAEAESSPLSIGESLAAPTETLTISQAELDFMDEVAPLMPRTPRSVKRFVNIYRLYKAALSTTGLARFLGTPERPGNFRAVQVLLALVTGAPRIAKRVFDKLDAGEASGIEHLADLVDPLTEVEDETWRTTLEALRGFARGKNDLAYTELKEVTHLVSRYSVHHMVSQTPGQSDLR